MRMSEQELNKEIGIRIRRARRSLDMTQSELGKRLGGIATSYVCEIEKGRRGMSLFRAYEIQHILKAEILP